MIFKRFFAGLIDMIIVIFITEIIEVILTLSVFCIIDGIDFHITNFLYSMKTNALSYMGHTFMFLFPISLFLLFIVGSFYFSYFDSSEMQGTLGKKLLNIKIVDTYGEDTLDGATAFLRFIACILINVTIIGYVVSIIMMLFRKDGKMLHDIFFDTKVVRR